MTDEILILFPHQASRPTEATLDAGEVTYLGTLRVEADEWDRLPRDPRYLMVDVQSGAILRLNETLGELYVWRNLQEIFLGPTADADTLRRGVWLECTPTAEAQRSPPYEGLGRQAPFLHGMDVTHNQYHCRLMAGRRCYFVTESAIRYSLYLLALAMNDARRPARGYIPEIRIAADQSRPQFADQP